MRTAALILIAGLNVWGQDSFEVASVKVAQHPDYNWRSNGGPGTDDPGLFTCEKCPLTVLIQFAFDLEYYKLVAPDWMPGTAYVVSFSGARETASEPRPNLFQAVQQQLGLQLVKKKELIEVVVLDRCEKVPTEN